MKTTFTINYSTKWGENVEIFLNGERHPLQWAGDGNWTGTFDIDADALSNYTYVITSDGIIVRTEWKWHNHVMSSFADDPSISATIHDNWNECPIPGCIFPREHQNHFFDKPGFRGAGTAIPVFALRSEKDFGIGEFHDLIYLIDYAAASGQCILQLLPVNDTTRNGTWKDSYPYSPVSSFALHPLYINLQAIGAEEDEEFKRIQHELNSMQQIDYPRVFKEKTRIMKSCFLKYGEKDLESTEFKKFCNENSFWLENYSEFSSMRDKDDPYYHKWIQFHLDKQFSKAVNYGRSKGISLKGDLPIGVSADSADAYFHPELLHLDSSAGAPPDFFSRDGQNWGFPTYNWDEMAKDGYMWWKTRLRHMSRYFDAFRIDHILGFFRIWEIPKEFQSGIEGHFNPALPYSAEEIKQMGLPIEGLFHEDPRHIGMFQPYISADTSKLNQKQKECFEWLHHDFFFHRHNELWRRKALEKLPELLAVTGMLACGEDLGMIPDCVPEVMEREKILSLKMRGMVDDNDWKYLSVAATSSHDMETLRMQFGEDPDPSEIKKVLEQYMYSPSMLAIFPLQDWLAMDSGLRCKDYRSERINEPSNPDHQWCYRLHIPLEQLTSELASNWLNEILKMVCDSGRNW